MLTDAEVIRLWDIHGTAAEVAKAAGVTERAIYQRASSLRKRGFDLRTRTVPGYESRSPYADGGWTFPREHRIDIPDGVVVVSSDHHYHPGAPSIAHRALIAVIKKVKPRLKILNGDILDGVQISRHDPHGFGERPGVIDELNVCQERVGEIEQALPNGCLRYWNVGNHCTRFERTLVSKVPQYARIQGFRLADHFPGWEFGWSTFINPDAKTPVMIKHRFASGGIHSAHQATLKAGTHTVSGHTHLLGVSAWGDYRGRRYGVSTGCISALDSPAMEYNENHPSPACSGFAVLTFKDGRLLHPEIAEVIDGQCWFRGQVVA